MPAERKPLDAAAVSLMVLLCFICREGFFSDHPPLGSAAPTLTIRFHCSGGADSPAETFLSLEVS